MKPEHSEALNRFLNPPLKVDDPTLRYDSDTLITKTDARTMVRIPTQPITFTSMDARRDLGWLTTMSLAAMREGSLVIRSMHIPVDPAENARLLDQQVKKQGGVVSSTWRENLIGQQKRARAVAPTRKVVYLEAVLGVRNIIDQYKKAPEPFAAVSKKEAAKWAGKSVLMRDRLARGGFRAEPVDADELSWIRRRAMCRVTATDGAYAAPRKAVWQREDVADEFADSTPTLGPNYIRILTPSGHTRFVATFVVSAMPTRMLFPSVDPWLAHLDRLPGFNVDSDLVLTLVPAAKAGKEMKTRTAVATDQRNEAAKANADLPIEVDEIFKLARELEYAIPSRQIPSAYGWARIRVEADSPAQLRERFEKVREHMKAIGSTGIDVAWPGGVAQAHLWAEGCPGAPIAPPRHSSWKQRWMLETVGCSLPHAGSTFGHRGGAYRGWTTGQQKRAAYINFHHAITDQGDGSVETSGGFAPLGSPRAGKSGAFGSIIDEATEAGMPSVTLEPPGRLCKLAELERHAGRIDAFDLLEVGGGAVDPMGPSLIPDPILVLPLDGSDQARMHADAINARALNVVRIERQKLTMETVSTVAWNLLHGADNPSADLTVAIRRVSRSNNGESSMGALIEDLKSNQAEKRVRDLGNYLDFYLMNDDDAGNSIAGNGSLTELPLSRTAIARIISFKNLVLPNGQKKDPGKWQPEEQLSAAVFGCGTYLARRLLLQMDPNILKFLMVDEAHVLFPVPAGYRVIDEALRHGPKNGIATGLATHNAVDLADAQIRDKISTWLLFRTRSAEEMAVSHAAAGLQDTKANREIRRNLRNGECIAVLDTGDVDRMQWDQWKPGLAEKLNTTPSGFADTGERWRAPEHAPIDDALAGSGVLDGSVGSGSRSAPADASDTDTRIAPVPA